MRGFLAARVRHTLGYKASAALRRSYGSAEKERRRLGKAFAPDAVNSVLRRICAASEDGTKFVAQSVAANSHWAKRALSGASLQLTEAI
jgi:hypothetical protein